MSTFKPKDIVMVYQDPVTRKKAEGQVRLLKLRNDQVDQEYWSVMFLEDGYITDRWINKQQDFVGYH